MAIKPPVLVPVLGLLRHAIGLPVEPGYHPTNTQVECLWPDLADLRTFEIRANYDSHLQNFRLILNKRNTINTVN